MAITQQEIRGTKEALKREIARQSRLISLYETKIRQYQGLEGGEREVARCTAMIERCRYTIEVAASELGLRPQEAQKRGPGRPPKNPAA